MFRYPLSLFKKKKRHEDHDNVQTERETTSKVKGSDLKNATDRQKNDVISDREFLAKRGYELEEETLGEGTFSTVKKARSRYHDKDIAIKIINRESAQGDFLERFLPRELEIILNLKNDYICAYHGIMQESNKVYIVMEYADQGDLLEYILKKHFVREDLAKDIFLQIILGVKYLHTNNILHRDLKCENILLSSDNRVLISDFGFAKCVEGNTLNETYCGSSAYAPIEILNGMPYDGRSADIWSIGCILYIMTTGTMPYDDTNKRAQILAMLKGPTFRRVKQLLSHDVQDLIRSILNTDVAARPTLEEIENDKWFTARNKSELSGIDEKASRKETAV